MDRSFLYGIVVLLALTDSIIYIQKTDPSLIANLLHLTDGGDDWKSKEPGWEVKPGDDRKDKKPDQEKPAPDKKNEPAPWSEKSDDNGDGKKCHPFRFWKKSRT